MTNTALMPLSQPHRQYPTTFTYPSPTPSFPFQGGSLKEVLLFTAVHEPIDFDKLVRIHIKTGSDENREILYWTAKTCANDLRVALPGTQQAKMKLVFSRIIACAEVIRKVNFETAPLVLYEAFAVASYIEIVLKNMDRGTIQYLSRSKTLLSRALQYDSSTKKIAIIANKSVAWFKGAGSFKDTRSALFLSAEDPSWHPQYAIHCLTNATLDDGERETTLQEFVNHAKLVDVRSVARFQNWTKCILSCGTPALSSIVAGYQTSLANYLETQGEFSLSDKLNITFDLLEGLLAMHTKRMAHGDIKPANLVATKCAGAGVKAAYIDFGASCDFSENQEIHCIVSYGYYGSIDYTAPELFAIESVKWPEKSVYGFDIFALGVTLLQLFYLQLQRLMDGKVTFRVLPWQKLIRDSYGNYNEKLGQYNDSELIRQNQERLKEALNTHIKTPIAALQGREQLNPAEKLELVLLCLAHPDPEERMSLQEALNQVRNIM